MRASFRSPPPRPSFKAESFVTKNKKKKNRRSWLSWVQFSPAEGQLLIRPTRVHRLATSGPKHTCYEPKPGVRNSDQTFRALCTFCFYCICICATLPRRWRPSKTLDSSNSNPQPLKEVICRPCQPQGGAACCTVCPTFCWRRLWNRQNTLLYWLLTLKSYGEEEGM